uniref:Retrotransposon gag domain-containing protein n=1 Tax=Chromera velia CCMP2878 TaxID=1169474 RepID=A0A0G4HJZ3_9ALVE|eukprot:Cvel_7131.t1-p1 / transcript=Cvel_7131.t1 / gene=Cvel_7131 / organism=Chromera_velia_CCMP2878 / gene_product=hypothetical protein / transcript_product=hypothetical protein / location=Cvel_scaffold366:11904-13801(-) / protein_length=383 / sequence_SO=supercontig / SO=protein_coding / is_pseudo=false
MFEAKASKANLTDAEWWMLVEKHLIKPITREWLAQESKKRLTFQQLKDAFLLRWTPTETEKNQAVYELSMLKLAPGDDFKTHKEAFEKLMRISQPGHPHQTRQKGKAQVAAADANRNPKGKQKQEQPKSDRFDKLEAQIAALTQSLAQAAPTQYGQAGSNFRGSQVTFVDVGYLAAADVEMKSPSVGLVALGNNSVPCVGETIAEIAHPSDPGKTFEHPVLVAEGSGYDIVLGMDFLRWHPEVRYAFEKDRLQVGDLPEFGVWYDDGVEPTKVCAVKRTRVPAWYHSLLQVRIDAPDGEDVLIRKGFPRFLPGLAVPAQIATVRAGMAVIEVTNVSRSKLTVGGARASVPPDPGGKSTSKEGVKGGRKQTDLPPVDLSAVPEE